MTPDDVFADKLFHEWVRSGLTAIRYHYWARRLDAELGLRELYAVLCQKRGCRR